MAINTAYVPMTVRDIVALYQEGKIRFDLAIQRNEVWDDDRASLFIHSMLYGYPFPPVYTMDGKDVVREIDDAKGDEKEYLWVLDGKQRLTRTIKFILNEWILSSDMPEVGGHDLANMNFDNLPEELKNKILNTQFTVFQFRNMTLEEVEETFYRLNMGAPLSRQEINRVRGGIEVLKILDKFKNMEFFQDKLNMSAKMKNRFMDEELLLQIMMIMIDGEKLEGYSKKAVENFIIRLKDHDLSEKDEKRITEALEYLNQAAEMMEDKARKRAFKKVHVPTLAVIAEEAIQNGDDVRVFEMWVSEFFDKDKLPNGYKELTKAGSGKNTNILGRLKIMRDDYRSYKKSYATKI